MFIVTECPKCHKSSRIEVEVKDYDAWQAGKLIQNAFPYLSVDQREQLMSGYDEECWDKLFDFDEEDQ